MLETKGEERLDRLREKYVLHKVAEVTGILLMTKRREANWIGHILRRNCLLKHFVEKKKGRRKNRSDGKTRNNI